MQEWRNVGRHAEKTAMEKAKREKKMLIKEKIVWEQNEKKNGV